MRLSVIWAISGLIIGVNLADWLYRHYGSVAAPHIVEWVVMGLIVAQLLTFTVFFFKTQREQKELQRENEASLERLRESLRRQYPDHVDEVDEFIEEIRVKA
jgi:uncharacterized membrane protein YjfL (UPF0719 family)